MEFSRFRKMDFQSLRSRAKPLSEFIPKFSGIRFSDDLEDDDADSPMLPVSRDTLWQQMLERVLGHVPEGAENAPPCNCEIFPILENYQFAGLAGLPPAVRLMDGFFPIRDQSKRGACFAFALVALCEYMLGKTVELSEQSLFHFTKLVTPGKVDDVGDGAFTLDAIHAIEEYGICPLSEWHYNPESWNYVEDPYNEGQGAALQRKLASAQKYRFRHWRMLSRGAVLQFKQTLSAGFPVYTGVLVTDDWSGEEVHRTGVIPLPRLLWCVRVSPPPLGLVAGLLEESGIDPESDEAELAAMQLAAKLVKDTVEYVGETVFGCSFSIVDAHEEDGGIEFAMLLDGKIKGGHALCLAGYADDPSYPGGGYFIARNSWSNDKWAPESPEMPGYALLPYAYVADFAQDGVAMSEFPEVACAVDTGIPPSVAVHQSAAMGGVSADVKVAGAASGASSGRSWRDVLRRHVAAGGAANARSSVSPSMSAAPAPVVPAPAPADGFGAWLAERSLVLDRPARDMDDILLRPGTPVLFLDPSNPSQILRDTPQNRARLRKTYDFEDDARHKAAEAERVRLEEERRKREAADFQTAVREIVDEAFARQSLVLSIEDIQVSLAARGFGASSAKAVRAALLALQDEDSDTYALCVNQFEREEFRQASALGVRKRVTK